MKGIAYKITGIFLFIIMIGAHFNANLFSLNFLPHLVLIDLLILLTLLWITLKYVVTGFTENPLSLRTLDVFVFLYLLLISSSFLLSRQRGYNDSFFNILLAIFVYFAIRNDGRLFSFVRANINTILLLSSISEVLVVHLQYFELIPNFNVLYPIGGVWGHPAATACTLSIALPFLVSSSLVSFSNKRILYAIINVFAIVLIITSFIILKSRAGILSGIIGIITLLWASGRVDLKVRVRRVFYFPLLVILITGITSILYYSKVESSNGRMYIWQKSVNLLWKNPFMGSGFNTFPKVFSKDQGEHFRKNKNAEEELLADYVGLAYNEVLEHFVELGLFGPLLLLLISLHVGLLRYRENMVDASVFSSLIAIIPWLLSWSLMKIFPIVFLLFIVLSIGDYKITPPLDLSVFGDRFKRLRVLALAIFASYIIYDKSLALYGRSCYSKALALESSNDTRSALVQYKKAYPILRNNEEFVGRYLSILIKINDLNHALEVANENVLKFFSPSSLLIMGNIYLAMDQHENALDAFRNAHYISPSKIYPKYCIIKLYQRYSYDKNLILEKINDIISTPQKTKSVDGLMIVEELKALKRDILEKKI